VAPYDGASLTPADLAIYGSLFANAFLAATVLPLPAEALLVGLLAGKAGAPVWLFTVATVGNTLGSLVNWGIGHGVARYRDRSWFPIGESRYETACDRFARYGQWSLLLAWVPIVGDPLTVVAGAMRVPLTTFLLFVATGKAVRYAMVVSGVGWWTA
jgi:membrane protein YqaA with SNARE-associated domain